MHAGMNTYMHAKQHLCMPQTCIYSHVSTRTHTHRDTYTNKKKFTHLTTHRRTYTYTPNHPKPHPHPHMATATATTTATNQARTHTGCHGRGGVWPDAQHCRHACHHFFSCLSCPTGDWATAMMSCMHHAHTCTHTHTHTFTNPRTHIHTHNTGTYTHNIPRRCIKYIHACDGVVSEGKRDYIGRGGAEGDVGARR